jgi:hypothetical protein
MKQLQADVDTQNSSTIFDLTDPDDQLKHFNQIKHWLLDLHAPLHKYVRKDPVIERNIAYRVWRRRKTKLERERKRVNYLTNFEFE